MQIKSKGLGDTVERITTFTGIKRVAEAVAKLAGLEGCGCDERKQYLNELFPYGKVREFRMINDYQFDGTKYKKGQIIKVSKDDDLYSTIIQFVRDGIVEEL